MHIPTDGSEPMLNVRDVRRELGGISGELVRKLLRAGAFPHAFKVGSDWFLPVSDLTPELRYRYGPSGPNRRPGPPRRSGRPDEEVRDPRDRRHRLGGPQVG